MCYNRIQSSLGKKSLTQRIKIKAFYQNLPNFRFASNSPEIVYRLGGYKTRKKRLIWIILNDFGPMCFAVPSGFGCPLRLIMTLRKLSTSHFQRHTPSIFFRTEKNLPPLADCYSDCNKSSLHLRFFFL